MLISELDNRYTPPTNSLDPADDQSLFRVLRVTWSVDSSGERGRMVTLGNSFKTVDAFLPGTDCKPWLQPNHAYQLRLLEDANSQSGWRVQPDTIKPAVTPNPLYLIPAQWTQEPNVIPQLIGLYHGLENRGVQRFWQRVFGDHSWLRPFLQQPASRHCHHYGPGGLLAHSVTVALMVKRLLAPLPNLLPLEVDATITVALLHDAAKVALVPTQPDRWHLPFTFREHERYLPYMLAEAMKVLEREDTRAYGTLLRILDDYCHPRQRPNNPLGEVVRTADHLDAHLDAREKERQNVGSHRNMLSLCGSYDTWVPA